mmetsp:Transcript_5441/g.21463  ORF Transcript_5441/g.21463 Transcript_5441/m.21463 type:complete len:263 (+) Transcript_5441:1261-2049(+)
MRANHGGSVHASTETSEQTPEQTLSLLSMLPIGESNYQREPPTRSRSPSLCTWSMVDATARVREDALAIAEPTLERSVELASTCTGRARSVTPTPGAPLLALTNELGGAANPVEPPSDESSVRLRDRRCSRKVPLARALTSVCDDVRGRAGTCCGVPPRDEPRERGVLRCEGDDDPVGVDVGEERMSPKVWRTQSSTSCAAACAPASVANAPCPVTMGLVSTFAAAARRSRALRRRTCPTVATFVAPGILRVLSCSDPSGAQ